MVYRISKSGFFLACSGYPECRNTKEFTRQEDGTVKVVNTTRETDEKCTTCGSPMVIKWGRNGHFLACSGYPECRNTKEYKRAADGTIEVVATTRETNEKCPTCGATMLIRRGRFGEFLACSKYPDCKTTSPISLGVACPRPNCGGYLTEINVTSPTGIREIKRFGGNDIAALIWDAIEARL